MPIRSSRIGGLILDPVLTRARVSSIDVDVEPSVGILAKKVDKLGLDIRSFKEPLTRAVKKVMIPSIRTNFLKSGRPRWEDLAERTWETKNGHGILRETDTLMKEMGYLKIWTIDEEKALIADLPEKIWYGKVHQAGFGGWREKVSVVNIGTGAASNATTLHSGLSWGEIPARPFIMMQKEDEEAIEEVFDEWLGERIHRAGLGNDRVSVRRHV